MAATAKEFSIGKAPKEINLKGDKSNPESAEHVITFPGGSISVCRTSDNKYWAHIEVYSKDGNPRLDSTRESKFGKIEMIRIDRPSGVETVDASDSDHFAVLIGTE
jgi:hypothetical protein